MGRKTLGRVAGIALAYAWGCTALAQGAALSIRVRDSTDHAPIPGVAIAAGHGVHWITDARGQATITWEGEAPAMLHFTHTGYQPRNVRIAGRDTAAVLVVNLVPRDRLLAPITVGRAGPVVVFQRPDLHAADLLVNDAGLWVLAYEHPRLLRAESDAEKEILRDVRLVLLDTLFNEVASCNVPGDVLGLRHDLRNDVVIEGTRHAFRVDRTGAAIALHPFGLQELRLSVLPWTDSIPGWALGSNANADYPALDHLAYKPKAGTVRTICTVVDSFMMDLFRSSYKYLKGPDKVVAMNLATELGVDKETVAGFMSGFSDNCWYQPLYAPLFVVGDTMLVFDHAGGRMRKFAHSFSEGRPVPLAYANPEEARNWTGRLVQDRATRQVYAEFQRHGTTWLRSIDPVSGRLGDPYRLAVRYPGHVQVHAGMVYYIWRPYRSLQKRTLYRERM